jgi:hypothetical protein
LLSRLARLAGRTGRARLTRLLLLLLLLRLLLRLRVFAALRAAASATTPAPARRGLLAAGRCLQLIVLLLLRARLLLLLLLLRPLAARRALLALIAGRALFLLLLGLLLATTAALRAWLLLARLSGALFVFAHLSLHEASGLIFLPVPELIVAAVRATFPTFRITLFAGAAEDAFREGHRESARIVHFATDVTDERRKTLRALIELAEESSPTACWDDARAIELLRSQATAGELRELGASEGLIELVFAEPHAG